MSFPLWYTVHYQDDDAKKLRKIAKRLDEADRPDIAGLLREVSEMVSDRLVPREFPSEKVTRFNDEERFTRGYSRDFLAYIVTYLGIWKGGPYRTVEFKVLDEHYQITRNPRGPVGSDDRIKIDGTGEGPSGGHTVVTPADFYAPGSRADNHDPPGAESKRIHASLLLSNLKNSIMRCDETGRQTAVADAIEWLLKREIARL